MITVPAQKNEAGHFVPFGKEAEELASECKVNKPVTLKITGMSMIKERSVIALNLLMACCQLVADNYPEENDDWKYWNTKEKVKKQLKVETNFIDMSKTIVDKHNNVHLHYRSFSFDDLKHMESVKLFDQCYPILAKKLKVSIDEIVANAKDNMRQ